MKLMKKVILEVCFLLTQKHVTYKLHITENPKPKTLPCLRRPKIAIILWITTMFYTIPPLQNFFIFLTNSTPKHQHRFTSTIIVFTILNFFFSWQFKELVCCIFQIFKNFNWDPMIDDLEATPLPCYFLNWFLTFKS